ncbi:feruloyl CoA ortho-hydroxylase 1-like protein [Tanacetum coccineum]|uniref:Feruloyl CoA ortho-hydroxylase 1-like protein n=1 Tax=Tanacetum coccineum TaxID=301880 RepID=A0ABQ4WPF2_9ASTR
MAPSISITNTKSLNIMDFVVNKGHGVKGLAELGLKALPHQYIQPPQERFDSSNEEPNKDSIPVIDNVQLDDPNNMRLKPSGLPACRNQALEYIKSLELVVKKLLMILMNGLNVKEIDEAKESKLMGSKSINLNYYPKCPNPELTVGVGRHSDVSTLTVLLQDEISGLYVRNMDTMKWIHVPPVSGSLVINVGDALQIISNQKYKSVAHRIGGPLQELVDSGEKPLYKNVVYSDYVKHFFRKAHDGKATIDFAKV